MEVRLLHQYTFAHVSEIFDAILIICKDLINAMFNLIVISVH